MSTFLSSCQIVVNQPEVTPLSAHATDSSNKVIKYDRKSWKHWTDVNQNCLNTRAEILKIRSKIPVQFAKKGCTVRSGQWDDYYFDEELVLAKDVDIDHLVPLKNAHDSGGATWSESEKEKFANDEDNLVITNRKHNRQKGSQGIDTWLPSDKNYACKYIKDWINIKKKYALRVSVAEQNSFDLLIKDCP